MFCNISPTLKVKRSNSSNLLEMEAHFHFYFKIPLQRISCKFKCIYSPHAFSPAAPLSICTFSTCLGCVDMSNISYFGCFDISHEYHQDVSVIILLITYMWKPSGKLHGNSESAPWTHLSVVNRR